MTPFDILVGLTSYVNSSTWVAMSDLASLVGDV